MKRYKTLFIENERQSLESERLNIDLDIIQNKRIFIIAKIKESDLNWLTKLTKDKPVVEGTLDIEPNFIYLNRVDSFAKGKSYAKEVLEVVLQWVKHKYHKNLARGYIENSNFSSQDMIKKLGGKKVEEKEHGSYWEIKL